LEKILSTYEAASRAILASISGQTNDETAYLSEEGRAGVFKWTSEDQSAQVFADQDQALYVAPASQPDGSAGAWHRIFADGIASAGWGGVVATGTGDYAPQISRLLAMSEVTTVLLPVGVIGVGVRVEVNGKTLAGAGSDLTTVQLSSSWTVQDPAGGESINSVIRGTPGSVGTHIRDLTVDGGKYAPQRTNGICMPRCRDFVVERFVVQNCTGYLCWANTNNDYVAAKLTGGVFRDGWTYNGNVHLEATAVENVMFDNVNCRDGDGDMNCETFFHPIAGSKNITYRNCSAIGTATVGILCATYGAENIENILFESCRIKVTAAAVGASVQTLGTGSLVKLCRFLNCDIESVGYIGLNVRKDAGSGCNVEIIGGSIVGTQEGITIDPGNTFLISGTRIRVVPTTGNSVPLNIDAGASGIIDAPIIDVMGRTAVTWPFGPNLLVVGQPVFLNGSAGLRPFGPGHRITKAIVADEVAVNGGTIPASASDASWAFNGLAAGTYLLSIEGRYSAGATGSFNFRLNNATNITAIGRGEVDSKADGANRVDSVLNSSNANVLGGVVDVANALRRFAAHASIVSAGGDASFNILVFSPSGSAKVLAGSSLTLERLA
jgi:hypothetical protein